MKQKVGSTMMSNMLLEGGKEHMKQKVGSTMMSNMQLEGGREHMKQKVGSKMKKLWQDSLQLREKLKEL